MSFAFGQGMNFRSAARNMLVNPALTWDATYRPAATALTASISNTNGTNAVVDCPGLAGVRAVRLQPNGQALYRGSLPSGGIDLSAAGTMLYVVAIPRDTNTATGSLQFAIFLGSTAGSLTNYREYRGYLQERAPDQPFVFAVPLGTALNQVAGSGVDGYSATNGTPDMTSIKTVAVQLKSVITGNSNVDNYFYVSDIFIASNNLHGGVMLGFDKQFASVRDNALPLLDAAGVKCTLYVSKFEIANSGRMTLADLQTASANGHKIALHSYSKFLDLTDTVNFPDAASIAAEIAGFETWAAANGLNYIPHHAAIAITNPWGVAATFAPEVVARDGYVLGGLRTWREGSNGRAFRKLNYRLRTMKQPNIYTQPLQGANQTDIETLIQSAKDTNGVLSLYSHECLVSPGANDTTPTMVSAVIAKAQAIGLPFMTPDTFT